jgi:hypothetical protein
MTIAVTHTCCVAQAIAVALTGTVITEDWRITSSDRRQQVRVIDFQDSEVIEPHRTWQLAVEHFVRHFAFSSS